MDYNARDAYLETEIKTATPQKLRLMLIDGALRFARLTLQHWEVSAQQEARETCRRCRNILLELLSSLNTESSSVAAKSADIYIYLIQAITQAELDDDTSQIDEVIRVLEIERGTWREVCEKYPHTASPGQHQRKEILPTGMKAIPPVDLPNPGLKAVADATPIAPVILPPKPTEGFQLEG